MLARYYVTGWSGRFGMWIAESLEARNMTVAKERFTTKYPTLKTIKAYKLREAAEKCRPNEAFEVMRHDQLQDLQRNVQYAFEEALEDKDETTWLWWYKHNQKKEKNK